MRFDGRTWTSFINYLLFQLGWFTAVFGAAAGHPWLATAAGLTLVAAHLVLVRNPRQEGALLLVSLFIGILVDGLHMRTGVLVFPIGLMHPDLPPPWILTLWLQFAMTLHYSMAWLAGRFVTGALLGAVSGALAYWAGVRVGAAGFGADLLVCMGQIGVSWGLCLPLLLYVAQKTTAVQLPHTYRCLADREQ